EYGPEQHIDRDPVLDSAARDGRPHAGEHATAEPDTLSGWRLGWAVSAAILFVTALACDAGSAPATSNGPTPDAAGATITPKPDFDAGVILEEFPEGAPRNEVRLQNTQDNRFMARASVKR